MMKNRIIQLLALSVLFVAGVVSCDDDKTDDPIIEMNKESLYVGPQGEIQKINLTANQLWEIKNIPDWLTVTPVSGESSAEITIKIEENRQPEGREGSFVVTAGNIKKIFNPTFRHSPF